MRKFVSFVDPVLMFITYLFLLVNISLLTMFIGLTIRVGLEYSVSLIFIIVITILNVIFLYSLNMKGLLVNNGNVYFDRTVFGYKYRLGIDSINSLSLVDLNHNVLENNKRIHKNVILVFYLKNGNKVEYKVEYIKGRDIKIIESQFAVGSLRQVA